MEEKNKQQQVIIKVCCVIASFVLWLYIFNVENPIRERKILVPVKITNRDVLAESKLVAVGENDLNISLSIKGNASELYSVKAEDFRLESDLRSYVLKKGENKVPVQVKKSPENIRILNGENLWISIDLDDLKEKIVQIKVLLEGKVKDGFYALQPNLSIKEAEISGASKELSSITSVVARCNVKDVAKDVNALVSLEAEGESGAIKNVQIEPSSVQVIVPVKKIKSVPVNIKTQPNLQNIQGIKSIAAMPDKVDIAGDEKVLSGITSLDIEDVDLNKLNGKDTIEAKIKIPKDVILVNSNGSIKLKVQYNKIAQKEFNLDIQTKNVGNNYNVSLGVNKATITISGEENILNTLKPESIGCFVDCSNLTEGEYKLPVTVTLPEGITRVSQNPTEVKVIIKSNVLEDKNVSKSK